MSPQRPQPAARLPRGRGHARPRQRLSAPHCLSREPPGAPTTRRGLLPAAASPVSCMLRASAPAGHAVMIHGWGGLRAARCTQSARPALFAVRVLGWAPCLPRAAAAAALAGGRDNKRDACATHTDTSPELALPSARPPGDSARLGPTAHSPAGPLAGWPARAASVRASLALTRPPAPDEQGPRIPWPWLAEAGRRGRVGFGSAQLSSQGRPASQPRGADRWPGQVGAFHSSAVPFGPFPRDPRPARPSGFQRARQTTRGGVGVRHLAAARSPCNSPWSF